MGLITIPLNHGPQQALQNHYHPQSFDLAYRDNQPNLLECSFIKTGARGAGNLVYNLYRVHSTATQPLELIATTTRRRKHADRSETAILLFHQDQYQIIRFQEARPDLHVILTTFGEDEDQLLGSLPYIDLHGIKYCPNQDHTAVYIYTQTGNPTPVAYIRNHTFRTFQVPFLIRELIQSPDEKYLAIRSIRAINTTLALYHSTTLEMKSIIHFNGDILGFGFSSDSQHLVGAPVMEYNDNKVSIAQLVVYDLDLQEQVRYAILPNSLRIILLDDLLLSYQTQPQPTLIIRPGYIPHINITGDDIFTTYRINLLTDQITHHPIPGLDRNSSRVNNTDKVVYNGNNFITIGHDWEKRADLYLYQDIGRLTKACRRR